MLRCAEDTGSDFLVRYVQATIDAANLRALLRCLRMGKGEAFLREVLVPGGEVELERYAAAVACRRFVLRCLMSGGTIAIGEPRSGPAGAREAACQLAAEYRRAAARWLRQRDLCLLGVRGRGKTPW